MATVVQKSAFKPGKYRGKPLSADFLRQFAEGTNKALSAGVPIPGLEKHAKLGADDAETDKVAATAGAGWLKKVLVEDDGSIGWEMDVPERIEAGIKDGTIKFTSPEFRPNYSAPDGRYSGPIIRHVAFTPLPKAHDQGALALAMSEDAFQFGEDDYEGPADEKKADDKPKDDPPADPPKNPDSPPKATDKTKNDALRECLSELGAELTSDWSLDKDGALDELLAALKTLAKAKSEKDATQDEPKEPDVKDAQAMPFSEDDIAALPASMQAKARKANDAAKVAAEQAMQFAEEREKTQRESLLTEAKAANIAPAGKQFLVDRIGAIQFSEGSEEPSLTIKDAIKFGQMLTPPGLNFSESQVTDVPNPEADMTEADADKLVDRMFGKDTKAA